MKRDDYQQHQPTIFESKIFSGAHQLDSKGSKVRKTSVFFFFRNPVVFRGDKNSLMFPYHLTLFDSGGEGGGGGGQDRVLKGSQKVQNMPSNRIRKRIDK